MSTLDVVTIAIVGVNVMVALINFGLGRKSNALLADIEQLHARALTRIDEIENPKLKPEIMAQLTVVADVIAQVGPETRKHGVALADYLRTIVFLPDLVLAAILNEMLHTAAAVDERCEHTGLDPFEVFTDGLAVAAADLSALEREVAQ